VGDKPAGYSSFAFSKKQRTRRAINALFLAVLEMVRMQAVVS